MVKKKLHSGKFIDKLLSENKIDYIKWDMNRPMGETSVCGDAYIYPIKYMRAWVTDTPDGFSKRKIPITFALHTAMCGVLGIGNNLNGLNKGETEEIKKPIYKNVRDIIQFGKLYRLKSMTKDEIHAIQYQKDNNKIKRFMSGRPIPCQG
ncbi:MAG: alpha-galactosidase [Anaerocolumna sp.]